MSRILDDLVNEHILRCDCEKRLNSLFLLDRGPEITNLLITIFNHSIAKMKRQQDSDLHFANL